MTIDPEKFLKRLDTIISWATMITGLILAITLLI